MIQKISYRIRLALLLTILVLTGACKQKYADSPPEDYERLFPFKGIDKPRVDDVIVPKPCNPKEELALSIYDPEAELPSKGRLYNVQITYSFRETESDGSLTGSPVSRLVVRYLDELGDYRIAASSSSTSPLDVLMDNGQEYTVSYQARSGQLLYIAVDGLAPRGASVKVSATARSVDGLITVPALGTHQFQNNEGIHLLPYPYCAYLTLP